MSDEINSSSCSCEKTGIGLIRPTPPAPRLPIPTMASAASIRDKGVCPAWCLRAAKPMLVELTVSFFCSCSTRANRSSKRATWATKCCILFKAAANVIFSGRQTLLAAMLGNAVPAFLLTDLGLLLTFTVATAVARPPSVHFKRTARLSRPEHPPLSGRFPGHWGHKPSEFWVFARSTQIVYMPLVATVMLIPDATLSTVSGGFTPPTTVLSQTTFHERPGCSAVNNTSASALMRMGVEGAIAKTKAARCC